MKFETSNLYMNPKYRPCIVKGKKALFHGWAEVSKVIPPSPMIGGHGGGVVADVFGIVEYDDGSVECLHPEYIRFSDKLFQAYLNFFLIIEV